MWKKFADIIGMTEMRYISNYIRAHSKDPREMIIYVTNKCNARCAHCFFWKEMKTKIHEMNLEQFRKIASGLSLEYLSLTGGEPFLRDDLADICETFNNHTKVLFIPTNGYLTDRIYKASKEILKRCNFQLSLEVSLDGLEKTHNKIRGIPVFKNAVRTIKKMRKIVSVSVLTVASNANYKELENIADFVYDLGVKHGITIVRGDPRDKNTQIPKEKINEVHQIVKGIFEKYMPETTFKEKLAKRMRLRLLDYTMDVLRGRKIKLVTCLAGRNIGVIYPNGDVSFCEMLKPIGNLNDYNFDFKALWNSKKADELRSKISDCYCIHDCFIPQSMIYNLPFLSREVLNLLC